MFGQLDIWRGDKMFGQLGICRELPIYVEMLDHELSP